MNDPLSFAWTAARQVVEAGRVGAPVALRLVDYSEADPGRLETLLACQADRACSLLGAEPALVWARATPAAGQIDVQLRGSKGESLLLSAGALGHASPLVGLTVIGQRGIASWEPGDESHTPAASHAPALSARAEEFLKAIGTSIETGEACPLGAARPEANRPQTLTIAAASRKAPVRLPAVSACQPLGVLLVSGAQTHQEMYAASFAADRRCRLVGLTDDEHLSPRRRSLNEQLAQSLGIPLLGSLGDALARSDVHLVSVCAEPERRAAIIERVLAAGKHLYLDKPLAASLEQASRIRAQARAAGVFSQMFSLVHAPAAQRVRAVLDSGRLGELVAIHCDLFFAKGPAGTAQLGKPRREDPRPSCFEAIESKRELYNIGVYPLALLAWLLKKPVRRVFATTGNFFFAEHQRNDMEDFAQASLEFEGGVTATLSVGRTGWHSHAAGGVNRTYLVGTRGAACIDAYRPRLEVWADEPAWPDPPRNPEDPMGFWGSTQRAVGIRPKQSWLSASDEHADVRHFLDCLIGGHDSDLRAEDAAGVLESLLAAYQSAAISQPVSIAR